METIAALLRAGREREGVAIDAAGHSAPYSYREFCTNAWKAGNLLGHYTHPGGRVAVVPGPKATDDQQEATGAGGAGNDRAESAQQAETGRGSVDSADPLLAALGGTLLGTTVALTVEHPVGADALVRPAGAAWRERYPAQAGCAVLAYGGPPDPSSVEHFEAALWSENPVEPPESVDRATPAVRVDGQSHSHGDLLDRAATAVDRHSLDGQSRVLLAGDVRDPGVLVAGVLAPLSVGATVVLDSQQAAEDVGLVVEGSEGRKD
jgi:hypothetical protein